MKTNLFESHSRLWDPKQILVLNSFSVVNLFVIIKSKQNALNFHYFQFQDNGQSRSNDDYVPHGEGEHDPSYMDKTRQDDLSPEHHEGNDPESFEFKMPSHQDLQVWIPSTLFYSNCIKKLDRLLNKKNYLYFWNVPG